MKRWLFDLARVALGLCLQVLGLWAALAFMPLSDEFEAFGPSSLVAVVAILAATGGLAGWVARRYVLAPALLLLWLAWAAFIGLDQWSDVKLGEGTYFDGVVRHAAMIAATSVALAAGVLSGYRRARRSWPATAAAG